MNGFDKMLAGLRAQQFYSVAHAARVLGITPLGAHSIENTLVRNGTVTWEDIRGSYAMAIERMESRVCPVCLSGGTL